MQPSHSLFATGAGRTAEQGRRLNMAVSVRRLDFDAVIAARQAPEHMADHCLSHLGEEHHGGVRRRAKPMALEGREAQVARARLLEFLKFRVLAAQESFFTPEPDPAALRQWLAGHWPQACRLSDADLLLTVEQARRLYTEEPRRGGP